MEAIDEEDDTTSSSSSSEVSEESSADAQGPPPEPPRPPRRAVNFYIRANFARAKRELGPYRRSSDVFRYLSEKWTKLHTINREPYQRSAAEDLERYKREKEDYERAYAEWSGTTSRPPARKRKKKPDAPARPKSAFKFYAEANWEKVKKRFRDEPDPNKVTWNAIRRRWNRLDDDDREVYRKKHAKDVKRYRREMAAVLRMRKLQREAYLREIGYLPPKDATEEESEESESESDPDKTAQKKRPGLCRMQ